MPSCHETCFRCQLLTDKKALERKPPECIGEKDRMFQPIPIALEVLESSKHDPPIGPFPRHAWVHPDAPKDEFDRVCYGIWKQAQDLPEGLKPQNGNLTLKTERTHEKSNNTNVRSEHGRSTDDDISYMVQQEYMNLFIENLNSERPIKAVASVTGSEANNRNMKQAGPGFMPPTSSVPEMPENQPYMSNFPPVPFFWMPHGMHYGQFQQVTRHVLPLPYHPMMYYMHYMHLTYQMRGPGIRGYPRMAGDGPRYPLLPPYRVSVYSQNLSSSGNRMQPF
ncbi:uncharacterized protein C1orf94 homolog isoform X2 [Hyla sarda]|uniref:uncharacterized protein C1orf94 homolog isoform X2 n=1 Tax=Hyla sarda TaxID=327740 RepID=UPI0024C2E3FE|nr:uncharacterized protein C1orf94 homolog isoform X2 [Hyla sarda]